MRRERSKVNCGTPEKRSEERDLISRKEKENKEENMKEKNKKS